VRTRKLTTPDLVVLSVLAEQPLHGHAVDALLETRNVRRWAAVSRPQIYYTLEKLTREGLIAGIDDASKPAGPERRVFKTTRRGIRALASALDDEAWTTDRCRPAFLTWLALSWKAPRGLFARQIARRLAFVRAEKARASRTLAEVLDTVGHPYHEAVWMLKLTVAGLDAELSWLATVAAEARFRRPAVKTKEQ
jgi:DNA-binding PadR family transcriptional regulator